MHSGGYLKWIVHDEDDGQKNKCDRRTVYNIEIYLQLRENPFIQCGIVWQDPQPTDMNPLFGPISGGTRLTIQGQELSTGADIEVLLGYPRNVSCQIDWWVTV